MSRRARAEKREIMPDARFGSVTIARFTNRVMLKGKKSTARQVVYGALDLAQERLGQDPVAILEQALKNATPLLEVRPRRVGGATYQVPTEVRPGRGPALAMKWIIQFARSRTGKAMAVRLAAEIADAFQGQGGAVKKREDTHKMAEANRAFVHYKW